MGAIKNTRRRASELRDLFRRRRVEKPRDVGYYKRSHVLVANIRKSKKPNQFEANFVHPRQGSALAPFGDHVYAPALAIAGQQMAVNITKKALLNPQAFEILLTEVRSIKFRRKVSPQTKIRLELTEEATHKVNENTLLKTFTIKAFVEGEKNSFTHGKFTLAITPKTG